MRSRWSADPDHEGNHADVLLNRRWLAAASNDRAWDAGKLIVEGGRRGLRQSRQSRHPLRAFDSF